MRAAPPVEGESRPGPTCGFNRRAAAERVDALRRARSLAVLPARNALPAPRVLVLRVQFSNVGMASSLPQTQALFQQVRDYFVENSYSTFFPTFTVTANLYTLPGSLASYGADCGADVACNTGALLRASTAAAAGDVSYPAYDHLMIYHAGSGQESTGASADIWSLYIDEDKAAGGKTFVGYTVVPESEASGIHPHGVICHEYGHQLGLPDLYNTVLGRSTVGKWDVMDYPYGAAAGDTPHLGAWSRYYLGFSAPVLASGTVVMGPSGSQDRSLRLPHPAANETFFLEYRWAADPSAAFGKNAPVAAGAALWRVDESLVLGGGPAMQNNLVNAPSHNGRGHAGVDLIEADGVQSGADAGSNDLFTDGTVAGADRTAGFDGTPSGMTVAVSAGTGGASQTVNVLYFTASPSLDVLRLASYPNPAGDPSRYPVRAGAAAGTVATLVVQLSKPLPSNGKMDVDLYDLDGQRVRSFPGTGFTLKAGAGEPTSDGKWVYEHDWDGKDEAGEPLAAGVYFYRARADGKAETGKLLLVR